MEFPPLDLLNPEAVLGDLSDSLYAEGVRREAAQDAAYSDVVIRAMMLDDLISPEEYAAFLDDEMQRAEESFEPGFTFGIW